jgi:hypothetical protein
MSIEIEIYRTRVRPGGGELWGFEPFGYRRLFRADEPTGGFIEAAAAPIAVALAPAGVVAETVEGELAVFLYPGAPGCSARAIYRYALEGKHGLTLVR